MTVSDSTATEARIARRERVRAVEFDQGAPHPDAAEGCPRWCQGRHTVETFDSRAPIDHSRLFGIPDPREPLPGLHLR